jgi:hypothetical protein
MSKKEELMSRSKLGWRASHALVAFLVLGVGALSSRALINPNFTPADLVRGSATIVELQLGSDGQVNDLKVLKGDAPTQLRLTVDESARESLPAGKHPALLFLASLAAAGETTDVTTPVGAIHTRDGWLGLYAGKDGGYTLASDKRDLKAVWAGSTAMLGRALKYVLNDPGGATFPVKVGVVWRGETNVVKLAQPIVGLQAVELTPGALPVLHILSPAGDRLGDRALPARSQRACWTDLNADGRLDLVSWDGTNVTAYLQGADGALAGNGARCELPGVTALVALRQGVAAGGARGVTIVTTELKVARTLPVTEDLGAAGPVVAGDFDADGVVDVMQAYEQGLVAWPGAAGEARVVFRGRLGKQLAAVDAGDFDGDGLLDLLLGGRQGASEGAGGNLLANTGNWTFAPVWNEGGEVHKAQTRVRNVQVCDINNDGKFDFLLTFERLGPAFLFNRGFRTFGTADELTLAGAAVDGKVLEAGNAFNSGAPYGVAADFDGDGAQDGAFATADGNVWVVWRDRGTDCHGLLLAVPPGAGPVRVTVTEDETVLGALLAAPGRPTYCGFAAEGGVKLEWTGSDGRPRTRIVPVMKALTRVELGD